MFTSSFKVLLRFAALCLAPILVLAPLGAAAQTYPNKPITIVLPYATGGSSEMLARMVGEHLRKVWGQAVLVDSKGGAGGQIGMDAVAGAAPDGYTLVLTASGTMGINPYAYAKLRYDPVRDFVPITVLVDLPFVLVVHPAVAARNANEFIALAKSKPGAISIGHAGVGTHQHLAQMQLAKVGNIQLNSIPYKGAGQALPDLIGGTLDAMLDNVGSQTPHIRGGKVRALGVSSKARVSALPDVPTLDEAGFKGYESVAWFGLAAPKGTPMEIVARLQAEVAKLYATPEVAQRLIDLGMVPVASTPADAAARVRANLESFGRIAKEIGLKPE